MIKHPQLTTMQREWFRNKDWWFSKKPAYNDYISHTFGHLLDEVSVDYQSTLSIIDKVLIWDQLPRHVFRSQPAAHIIAYYLRKAIHVLGNVSDAVALAKTDDEFVFLMLPFRHTKDYEAIHEVMLASWKRLWVNTSLMRRFIRATFMDAPTMDQSPFVKCSWRTRHMAKTRDDFVRVLDHNQYDTNTHTQCIPDLSAWRESKFPCIVSLSGGVDSMVLLHLLVQFLGAHNVCCVHINYDNRDTSALEEEFVQWWCSQSGIKLVTRTCQEIHRPACMQHDLREVYEVYTKRVRFGTYHTACRQDMHKQTKQEQPVVCLGHNSDDCFENILSNISTRSKYEDLKGMSYSSYQEGVTIIRPLIHVAKRHILAYARYNNIPFLYDSTPSWTQRGKIRDAIVPALTSWNSNCIKGMLDMSDAISDMHEIVMLIVHSHVKLLSQRTHYSWLFTLDHTTLVSLSKSSMYWKGFVKCAFHVTLSQASLKNFLSRIATLLTKHCHSVHVVLNKDLDCRITKTPCLLNYDIIFIRKHNDDLRAILTSFEERCPLDKIFSVKHCDSLGQGTLHIDL